MVAIGVTKTNSKLVVVFSQNYLPISRVNIKRAIILLVTGKAEPLDFASEIIWEVRSPSIVLPVPAYIRLNYGTERVWKIPPVSRKEILKRDRDRCQYCGSKKQLTIDHIIPRSKGGQHTWDNVVIACANCNSRKGDKTPEQAGMVLKTKAKAPAHPAIVFAEKFWQATGI
jgi:5-methylcytosine-specific restriction endonuclease McrA